ncbi:MAG: hypothetical protein GXO25_02905 [Euryarchaeota archaeon]|nr:hypothetical protein [Euryarchaeota archaeon]
MVVKSKIGRRRYIVIEDTPRLPAALRKIKSIDMWSRIVYRDGTFAILRCKHWHKEQIIQTLNNAGIKTYRTTGTIKKAKRIIKALTP